MLLKSNDSNIVKRIHLVQRKMLSEVTMFMLLKSNDSNIVKRIHLVVKHSDKKKSMLSSFVVLILWGQFLEVH